MARVTKLSITGYRSIKDEIEITFPDGKPLVLVGENNAGKSNIVRALNLMLGQYSPGYYDPEDHEFFGRDPAGSVRISLYFDDDDALGGKWSEIRWTCDSGGVSFRGVCPGRVCQVVEKRDVIIRRYSDRHLGQEHHAAFCAAAMS